MTKIVKGISVCIIVLTFLGMLCGCKANIDVQTEVIYDESYYRVVEFEDLKLSINQSSRYKDANYLLDISVTLTNKEYSTKTYTIKNVQLTKESTGAKYTVEYAPSLVVEAELNQNLHFQATIPSSPSKDKYKLDFEISSYKITYYLYEKPDDLREDWTVNYYLENRLVKSEIIKDRRTIQTPYLYEYGDDFYYCDTWYTDAEGKNEFSFSTQIAHNTDLYGFRQSYYRKVDYWISNKIVKTTYVKYGENLKSLYVYDYDDTESYCDTWYTDQSGKYKFDKTKSITQDINLYGFKQSVFKFSTYSSDAYAYLTGLNHYPANGILILPKKYQGKSYSIFPNALQYLTDVEKIYIPKTLHSISSGNFSYLQGKNKTIYFEGTKEEWEALFDSPSYVVTTNVVYNADYPR